MPEKGTGLCDWAGCEKHSNTELEGRGLCLDHFLEHSQRKIQTMERAFNSETGERNVAPDTQSFLSNVISQTMLLAAQTRLLAPTHRETLLVLSTRAAEMYKRIQREPRLFRRIGCLVRTGVVSTETAEKCYTVNVSLRGACVELKQGLRVSQMVILEREDTRRSARGKVAWVKQAGADRYMTGLELQDVDDFWGLGPEGIAAGV